MKIGSCYIHIQSGSVHISALYTSFNHRVLLCALLPLPILSNRFALCTSPHLAPASLLPSYSRFEANPCPRPMRAEENHQFKQARCLPSFPSSLFSSSALFPPILGFQAWRGSKTCLLRTVGNSSV